MIRFFATILGACSLMACAPGVAQEAPASVQSQNAPQRILFVGNSFTMGANSAVLRYRPDSVEDINGEGVGGIPALFAKFAEQADLAWSVAHETRGGTTLDFHLNERRAQIERPWDVVVMQQFSVLDPQKPGDASDTVRDAPALADMFAAQNDDVQVYLLATWTRADQAWKPEGHWYGQPVEAMTLDVRRGLDQADAASDEIDGVIPVGEAWNRAMATGIADPNPYDGRDYGKIDLWSYDHYHASAEGSYLEALVIFAQITGYDVRRFGPQERAAHELGIDPKVAEALQKVAMAQLGAE
ncbi:DUF4886 domain-containing protein [Alteriqipengyuania lutimaris]|uniref:PEP-CTERM sorting domain-containing protein n=1 Tax=Alteriqipengyuania lutimaris TaxID=1538146 RepID=A0A395LP74_9SPHN|nr:DUF4886 domain-containing protein [Alteriqipengyuania lutimaris]MBB3032658.1 hypothetical protein [Alteriqipengyuania lutimaris]RDS78227.1 PEP-CTERM sorting domain-containing protein [Alteriqipengyuania lutimaris]